MSATFRLRPPVVAPREQRSLWITQSGLLDHDELDPLGSASVETDVAIIGGGYTGLWTALRIRERSPQTRVTVLEADYCGSGASGRNGGQVHSWYESLTRLSGVCGPAEALRLAAATAAAIDELEELQSAGLDIDLRLDGWLWTANTTSQLGSWDGVLATCRAAGVEPYDLLDAAEARRLSGSSTALGGVLERRAGTVNPAKLALVLRDLCVDRGVIVHEGTAVSSVTPGAPALLGTSGGGTVRAGRVVLANNAWAASIPELRRKMFLVDGLIVATPPIPERLDAIGWVGGQAICDSQQQVLYFQRSTDGRVIFGRGGGGAIYKDHLGAGSNRNATWVPAAVAEFRRLYPELADVPIESDWTGPVDLTPQHLPVFGSLRGHPSVIYGVGWSGSGLSQIPVGSRILASLALGEDDEWSRSGLVEQPVFAHLPPEPIRFAGSQVVRRAVTRKNTAERNGSRVGPVASWLSNLVPHADFAPTVSWHDREPGD